MKRFKKTLIPLLLTAGLLCAACTAAGPSMPVDPSATASPSDTARHIKLSDAVSIQTPQVMPYAKPLDIKELSPTTYNWLYNTKDLSWLMGGFNPWWDDVRIDVWQETQAQSAIERTETLGNYQLLVKNDQGEWIKTVQFQCDPTDMTLVDAQENDEYYLLLFGYQVIAVSKRDGSVLPLVTFDDENAPVYLIKHMKVIGNSLYYEDSVRVSDNPNDPLYFKCYPRLIKLDILTLESTVIRQFEMTDYGYYNIRCYFYSQNQDYMYIGQMLNKAIHIRKIDLADPDEEEELVFESDKWLTSFHEMAMMDRFLIIRADGPSDSGTYLHDPERGDFFALPPLSDQQGTLLSNIIDESVYLYNIAGDLNPRLTVYRYDLGNPDESAAVEIDISKYAELDNEVMSFREQDGKTSFTLFSVIANPEESTAEQRAYDNIFYEVTIDIP